MSVRSPPPLGIWGEGMEVAEILIIYFRTNVDHGAYGWI